MENPENALIVKMFGGFSITWKGTSVIGRAKSSESQFVYLMQAVLHNRHKGISRDELEDILFGDRDVSNVHHALRTVVYNAKKKLKQAGLPDVEYFEKKKGIYFWTKEIPVIEDASEFDRLCREADVEKDLDVKKSLYVEACHLYSGEFLPAQVAVIWAAQEARRYRGLFCHCMENAVILLRMNEDYFQIEQLGIRAALINPLADWEVVTMEALTALGRYDDARKLYDDTVELYFKKEGLRPSKRLMELLNALGEKMNHPFAVLDTIQAELTGKDDESQGGYFCSYPVFQGIYRMVERLMERGGQSVYLMLCTVVDSKGNPMQDGSVLEGLSQRLGDAILHSVRHSDAISKYGKGQYLVLLVNTTLENCQIVQKRINYHFIVSRQRTGIQYYVNSVICSPGSSHGDKKG